MGIRETLIGSTFTFGLLVSATLASGCSKSDQLDPAATKTGTTPTAREEATVEAGAASVKVRDCTKCHEADMGGSTANRATVAGLKLYPPNLTNDDTGVKKWSDDALANAIRNGFDYDGLKLCPQMTHVSTMSDYEAFSIVMYLRSLPPQKRTILRSVCPPLKTKAEQSR